MSRTPSLINIARMKNGSIIFTAVPNLSAPSPSSPRPPGPPSVATKPHPPTLRMDRAKQAICHVFGIEKRRKQNANARHAMEKMEKQETEPCERGWGGLKKRPLEKGRRRHPLFYASAGRVSPLAFITSATATTNDAPSPLPSPCFASIFNHTAALARRCRNVVFRTNPSALATLRPCPCRRTSPLACRRCSCASSSCRPCPERQRSQLRRQPAIR